MGWCITWDTCGYRNFDPPLSEKMSALHEMSADVCIHVLLPMRALFCNKWDDAVHEMMQYMRWCSTWDDAVHEMMQYMRWCSTWDDAVHEMMQYMRWCSTWDERRYQNRERERDRMRKAGGEREKDSRFGSEPTFEKFYMRWARISECWPSPIVLAEPLASSIDTPLETPACVCVAWLIHMQYATHCCGRTHSTRTRSRRTVGIFNRYTTGHTCAGAWQERERERDKTAER